MSHWNHRIIRHKEPSEDWYAIHETYYDEEGLPYAWTVEPGKPVGENVDGLIWILERMLEDAKRFKDDVIDYDSIPTGKCFEEE